MNFSDTFKTIWWAQELAGSDLIKQVFEEYQFSVYDEKKDEFSDLKNTTESHSIKISGNHEKYIVICTIRNPYDRVWNIFLEMMYPNIVVDKFSHEIFIKKFNIWVKSHFLMSNGSVKIEESITRKDDNLDYFKKWVFRDKKPDIFIRFEKLDYDLKKLDFLKDNFDFVEKILSKSKYNSKPPINFQKVYELESARLVYNFFKSNFHLADYDPFSFTTKSLTNNQKIDFLHNTLTQE